MTNTLSYSTDNKKIESTDMRSVNYLILDKSKNLISLQATNTLAYSTDASDTKNLIAPTQGE